MKTLIISSSLNPSSHSFELCKALAAKMPDSELIDLREMEINFTYQEKTADFKALTDKVAAADNYVFGMAVHNYSVNDSLKAVVENCFHDSEKHKFFGLLCAAGSPVSYLSTTDFFKMLIFDFEMIAFPKIVFHSGKEFTIDAKLQERIDNFAQDFTKIGNKLILS